MDPCTFVRVLIGNLSLKLPVVARPTGTGVHPSATPCYCKIRLGDLPYRTAAVPLAAMDGAASPPPQSPALAAGFILSRADLDGLDGSKSFLSSGRREARLQVELYTGRRGTTCGVSSGRLLGRVSLTLDLKSAAVAERAAVLHNGWIAVGKKAKDGSSAQLYLTVRALLDPRFVFEFDGEPECSPQVFQVQGSMRQPVFTCKFSCRNSGDRYARSRSERSEPEGSSGWLAAFRSEKERPARERKGWSVTVHDLSGSPVALASMVTPFVPSPGTDRVSRSNPGAWLILLPGDGTWKPWGRLEAWRERGCGGLGDRVGYRFELLPHGCCGGDGVVLAEASLRASKGGKFSIDLMGSSPGGSPRGSGDPGMWTRAGLKGFVMSAAVEGENGGGGRRPAVEVGVQHVACAGDASAFVALAAAVDLSIDACRLFSHKLRKELSRPESMRWPA